jgi:hypothetical protein
MAKWLESNSIKFEKINDDAQSTWKSILELNARFSRHHKKAVVMKMQYKAVNHKELSAYNPIILQEIDPHPAINTAFDAPPTHLEIKAAL